MVRIQDAIEEEECLPTLRHELGHVWFGSYTNLGKIDESLATYMEISLRDSNSLNLVEKSVLRYSFTYGKPLAKAYEEGIPDPRIRRSVRYYKGAFVFRSLQFVLGNETFFEGLRELLRVCHYKECNLTDVQDVFENTSRKDLEWFFRE